MNVNFQKAFISNNEFSYVQDYLLSERKTAGEKYRQACLTQLHKKLNTQGVHLTSSCTASLEIACLIIGIGVGDEVIMPSYTFSSTANAVVLRGATPVFVDIKQNTLNLDEELVEQAISKRTRAIIAVHYAGMSCNMRVLKKIANEYGLILIEDAAQGFGTEYFGEPLGTLGDFGAISFHQSKNIHCGEGGAFISADAENYKKAAYIIEKGTNRLDMINGKCTKYHWVSMGSSYVLSDMQTALLSAQLESDLEVTQRRSWVWHRYQDGLRSIAALGKITQPTVEQGSSINGHIYYVLIDKHFCMYSVQDSLAQRGVIALTHYEPLHLSPAGRSCARQASSLPVTEKTAGSLLRLPIWPEMIDKDIDYVIECLDAILK